jgi:molybdopterin synthase catalytic subunit
MRIEISEAPFQPWRELADYEALVTAQYSGKYGACAAFTGTMRDFNEGDDVDGMSLEHYPGMTERHLERICNEAMQRWKILDYLLIHRVGELNPNDPIVLIVVWSSHRKDAFEACRFIMEDLKSKAPFWKKESLGNGDSRWVEKNTDGY